MPVDTALHMTLPSAGPYVLTGVKLAVAYSLIGVIGSEFIMSRGGMGYEISFAYTNFDNATMYPADPADPARLDRDQRLLSRWEQRAPGPARATMTGAAKAQAWRERDRADRRSPAVLAGALLVAGDVALRSPLATLRYTVRSSSRTERSGRICRRRCARSRAALAIAVVIGLADRLLARASTASPATRWSR